MSDTASNIVSSHSLYYTEGSSDKEYHIQLRRSQNSDDLYTVDFQYGRRGSALRAGTKTKTPISYDLAKKSYDKVVAEKLKEGYTPDVSGAVFQDSVAGEQFSGFIPQLPQTVRDESAIATMTQSSNWYMEEKFDGENRQVRVEADGQVFGINKRGMIVPLPKHLAEAFATVQAPALFSGELVGNTLHVFDVQEIGGTDLRDLPYSKRVAHRQKACDTLSALTSDIQMVKSVSSAADKLALMDDIRQGAREGVVFKRQDAKFTSGKLAASNSDQFKFKFTEDCTVRVSKISKTKRSVEVEINGPDGNAMPLGSVTIPSNYDIPDMGALVSVTYLHLFEGGSLFQAQYKGVRTDCEGPDSLDQFKIKAKQAAPKPR